MLMFRQMLLKLSLRPSRCLETRRQCKGQSDSQRGERQQQVFLQAAAAAAPAAVSSSSSAAAAARYLCCRLPRRAGHIQSGQCHRRLHSSRTFKKGQSGDKVVSAETSGAVLVSCVERELFEEGGCGEARVCKAWASRS